MNLLVAVAGRRNNGNLLVYRRWLGLLVGITAIIATTLTTVVEAFVSQQQQLLLLPPQRPFAGKFGQGKLFAIINNKNNLPTSFLKSTQQLDDNNNYININEQWTPTKRTTTWENLRDNLPVLKPRSASTFLLPVFLSRSVTAVLTAVSVFMLSMLLSTPCSLVAFADDGSMSAFPSSEEQSFLVLTKEASPSSSSSVSSPIPSPPLSTVSSSSSSSSIQNQQRQEETVIEEVWNLINKYYLDGTFNNQDWNQVKQNVLMEAQKQSSRQLLAKDDDDDASTGTVTDATYMKIVTKMVQSLNDKYTRILDAQQYASIQKYDLIGVGVTLMPNANQDMIVGAPPIAGSSSDRAGLQPGDFVMAVNGVPTRGRNAFDIIDQIAESANAKTVTFTILRNQPLSSSPESSSSSSSSPSKSSSSPSSSSSLSADGSQQQPSIKDAETNTASRQTFDVTMERQSMLQVKDPIQYKLSKGQDKDTKVGYIRILEFNALVNASLQKALLELQQLGANAYVLDLRGNTGGAFQSAVEISGLFLRDRVATYVVDRNQVELPFRTPPLLPSTGNGNDNKDGALAIDPNIPMVIWLDGMSASASEVLAGSLHDNCRAVTMGDTSFGKGLIQAVYGLQNGAGLVLTVARYVTPSGYEIQGKGIIPDIVTSSGSGNSNNNNNNNNNMIPAPVFVPILGSDTSKIDFKDIAKRLDGKTCQVPPERNVGKVTTKESLVNSG
jgi:carboxyl-terminal processing protease